MTFTRATRACLGLAVSLLSVPAVAGTTSPYMWAAPAPEIQLLDDRTPIPAGKGAIFVPALTDAASEPNVLVVSPDGVIPARPGQRIIVNPGRYVVVAASTDPRWGTGSPLDVAKGRTTIAPVTWGALRVEVVDKKMRRHDARYTLIHEETGEVVEVPSALETEAGVTTFLLRPGLYRMVEAANAAFTTPDFATVHVPKGGLVDFRLFVEPATGNFRGGGVIPRDQALPTQDIYQTDWTGSLLAGLEGDFSSTAHVPGAIDATYWRGNAFIDGSARYSADRSAVELDLDLKEGQQYIGFVGDGVLPIIKGDDRLQATAKYTFLFNDGVGLYARATGKTQLFDTYAVAVNDTTVALRKGDGSVETIAVPAAESYKIADAFAPTIAQASAGLDVRFVSTTWMNVNVYGGPAVRLNRYGGAYISEDNPRTAALEYTKINDFDQAGLSVGLSGFVRLSGWVTDTVSFNTFLPIGDADRPAITLDNSLNLRITDVISANYDLGLQHVPQVSDEIQLRQGAFLRASWSLL